MPSRIYLITLKDPPTVPDPVMGGFLVDANSPSQALRAITLGSLDCRVASGLEVAQMLKAGAVVTDARAPVQEELPLEGQEQALRDPEPPAQEVAAERAMDLDPTDPDFEAAAARLR